MATPYDAARYDQPKIYLVHPGVNAMASIVEAFRTEWPQARIANLLEDSLPADLIRDKDVTDAMIQRFRALGDYCVSAGAEAILFTCSAFGKAIDAVKLDHPGIPVLKPNEAAYELIMTQRTGKAVLLNSFEPSSVAMMAEIEECMAEQGVRPPLEAHVIAGASDALFAKRMDEYNRLIADAAAGFADYDLIVFGQASMGSALKLAQARVRHPIVTTPTTAVRKLKAMMAAGTPGRL